MNNLSAQQETIMSLAITGAYNREIAEELGVQKGHVDTQVCRINKKYGTRDKMASILVHLGELARARVK